MKTSLDALKNKVDGLFPDEGAHQPVEEEKPAEEPAVEPAPTEDPDPVNVPPAQ